MMTDSFRMAFDETLRITEYLEAPQRKEALRKTKDAEKISDLVVALENMGLPEADMMEIMTEAWDIAWADSHDEDDLDRDDDFDDDEDLDEDEFSDDEFDTDDD